MDEVLSILIAFGALVVGTLGIGWAYGDFRPRQGISPQPAGPEQKPASPET